jgi:hypothetical protein
VRDSCHAGDASLRSWWSVLDDSGLKLGAVYALCAVGMSVMMRVLFMAAIHVRMVVDIFISVRRVDEMCWSRHLLRWYRSFGLRSWIPGMNKHSMDESIMSRVCRGPLRNCWTMMNSCFALL